MNRRESISYLKEQITHHLPGEEAHLRMLPYIRELKPLGKHVQPKESAVLIVIWFDQTFKTCVIKRTSKMRNHAGQFALPGGKFDIEEDRNLMDTALRETFEEVGLNINKEDVIGPLSKIYIPVSTFYITPYLAFISGKPQFQINPDEVEALDELIIDDLFGSKGNMQVDVKGNIVTVPSYNYHNTKIWGATAMILSEMEIIWNRLKEKAQSQITF
ncbi:CoA pyrophosphatase [Halosquirtibacter xylanolyticus]|uniref:NUDIX hydrolase n=1 Tax=Halosquirtibacter xylanolyticus TaxID=3374599 RepID=UPI00374A8B23|nr:CoA pyrophosphatase [Prolixibacteraceae bacterium]